MRANEAYPFKSGRFYTNAGYSITYCCGVGVRGLYACTKSTALKLSAIYWTRASITCKLRRMKLILANNQSEKFVNFYRELQAQSAEPFEYAGYSSLLFICDSSADKPVRLVNLASGKELDAYDGVYINGYLSTYELAAAVAIACDSYGIGYANREMHDAPSLSKVSMYARLAAAKVPLPFSLVGSKAALLQATDQLAACTYPAILKRADADRGIDNYKVSSAAEVQELLTDHDDLSLWVLQEFIENDGFYLISFYGEEPVFSIHRSLEARPDGNEQKAHMYKPKGGANATLIDMDKIPAKLMVAAEAAIKSMNRQIASVDCLYDPTTDRAWVLEVNYNPQLVTIETFKDVRVKALLDYLPELGT